MTAEPADETPDVETAAIETRQLKHGLTAVLLSRDQVGPPSPRREEPAPASGHRRSRRSRAWGETSSPRSTPWGRLEMLQLDRLTE